jgi:hypothetical protein
MKLNMSELVLIFLVLMIPCLLPGLTTYAQSQDEADSLISGARKTARTQHLRSVNRSQSQTHAESPSVTLNEVRLLEYQPETATAQVRLDWSAQMSPLITATSFELWLEVIYSDGGRQSARASASGSARQAELQIPLHPTANSTAMPKSFQATVNALFKTTVLLTASSVFPVATLAKPGGEAPGRPGLALEITQARQLAQCSGRQDCFEVRWVVRPDPGMTINGFNLDLEVAYQNGTKKTISRQAASADRQATLSVDRPQQAAATLIKVNLVGQVTSTQSNAASKKGVF